MFLDRKNQYCENDYTTQSNLTVDVDLDHLAEGVFVSFLHCNVTLFPPLFHTVLFGRKSLSNTPLRSEELCSTL